MTMADLSPEQQTEAFGIIIPEYEQQLSEAASRGDDKELARVSDEYATARADRYRELHKDDEQSEPVDPEPVNSEDPPTPGWDQNDTTVTPTND